MKNIKMPSVLARYKIKRMINNQTIFFTCDCINEFCFDRIWKDLMYLIYYGYLGILRNLIFAIRESNAIPFGKFQIFLYQVFRLGSKIKLLNCKTLISILKLDL